MAFCAMLSMAVAFAGSVDWAVASVEVSVAVLLDELQLASTPRTHASDTKRQRRLMGLTIPTNDPIQTVRQRTVRGPFQGPASHGVGHEHIRFATDVPGAYLPSPSDSIEIEVERSTTGRIQRS